MWYAFTLVWADKGRWRLCEPRSCIHVRGRFQRWRMWGIQSPCDRCLSFHRQSNSLECMCQFDSCCFLGSVMIEADRVTNQFSTIAVSINVGQMIEWKGLGDGLNVVQTQNWQSCVKVVGGDNLPNCWYELWNEEPTRFRLHLREPIQWRWYLQPQVSASRHFLLCLGLPLLAKLHVWSHCRQRYWPSHEDFKSHRISDIRSFPPPNSLPYISPNTIPNVSPDQDAYSTLCWRLVVVKLFITCSLVFNHWKFGYVSPGVELDMASVTHTVLEKSIMLTAWLMVPWRNVAMHVKVKC